MAIQTTIVPAIQLMLQRFLHCCLPNCCLWCDFPVHQPGAQLCDHCQAALPRLYWSLSGDALQLPAVGRGLLAPQFDAVWSLSWYQQPWSHFISAWKLQQELACGQLLRQQLALALPLWRLQDQFAAVAYVPVHPKRLRERGFNQSQQLAATVAAVTGLPLLFLLRKVICRISLAPAPVRAGPSCVASSGSNHRREPHYPHRCCWSTTC